MTSSTRTEDLLRALRDRCLALPEVTEGPAHGAPTWFVRRLVRHVRGSRVATRFPVARLDHAL
jgi:hypothetical protein